MTTRQPAPTAGLPARTNRSRDSAASKQALLHAAQSLFGLRGFEGTTIRDIGDLAGVDAALIARYFGSKADLYIAAVVAEGQGDQPSLPLEGLEDMAKTLVARTDEYGLGPVTQALIRSDTSDEIRTAAQAHLIRRLVEPMTADLTRSGTDRPRLRAEIVVSALIGINLGRALGWFDELPAVPREQLVDLIATLLGGDRASPSGDADS
jgi:AcrR family transcriptional regulator